MKSTDRFNALHNKEVTRQELTELVRQAKAENNTEVVYRVSKILLTNPDIELFEMDITTKVAGQTLSGAYAKALDAKGRLKKGWRFEKGRFLAPVKAPQAKAKYNKGAVACYHSKKVTITRVSKVLKSSIHHGKEAYKYALVYANGRKVENVLESKLSAYKAPKKKAPVVTINQLDKRLIKVEKQLKQKIHT